MKLAPVSADLVIKLALVGLGLAVAYALIKSLANVTETVANAAGDAVHAVSPFNNDNIIYQATNAATGGAPDIPIGTRIYNLFHPDEEL